MENNFFLLFAVLIITAIFTVAFVLFLNFFVDLEIPFLGVFAILLGAVFSILMTGGLMMLIFWSHYNGYDSQASNFEIDKNSSD